MRRGIAAAAGAVISKIIRPPSPLQSITIEPPLREFRRRAVGRQIAGIGRLGKRVVLDLDSGDRMVIEPRMTGLVFLVDPARPQTPAAGHRTVRSGRLGRTDLVLGPTRPGRRATRPPARVRGDLRPCENRTRCPGDLGWPNCDSVLARARGQSRSHCSIKKHWPAWEISMPRKFCIVPAFIRHDLAGGCEKTSGSGSTPKCSACCTTPSSTRAPRFATGPIASPATCRAITSSITASISGTGRPASPAGRPVSFGSCRPSDRHSIVRSCQRK